MLDWHWPMSLSAPPILHHIGISRHFRGSADYRLWSTWCIHLFDYHGEMRIKDRTFPIAPGYASVTPANLSFSHTWFEDDSRHITVHFQPPALETGIEYMPAMTDVSEQFETLWGDLVEAIEWFSTHRRRSEARVWDVLWRLAALPQSLSPDDNRMHPLLQLALQRIEVGLGGPISISALAEDVGLSHNHLIRLFRQSQNSTVGEYIRKRRAERAVHLLVNTTMPIKSVANSVGVPDVQQFNKLMRRVTGKSPTDIRRG